jgi:integrase
MSYAERRKGKLSGRWVGEEVVRGHRYRQAFDTKPEADGYEAYVKATGQEPPHKDGAKHTGVTFAEVAALCRDAGGPRRGRWKAERDPSVMQRLDYVVAELGALDIAAVTTLELDRLVRGLQRRPGYQGRALSGATINRYLTAASAVLTFASQRGYIQGKPAIPLQEEDGAREAVVSEALEAALFKWMTDHGHHAERLCCQVLIETGMRAGELQVLTPEQIENEWITLRASQVKTKRARKVYISEELARNFRALVASGARPNAARLRTIFKRAAEACGDSGELVIHSLRHTRTTRLLEAGVDPQVTMEMMGWTSFNTMTRYRHVKPHMHVEAAKKVTRARGDFAENGQIVQFDQKILAG